MTDPKPYTPEELAAALQYLNAPYIQAVIPARVSSVIANIAATLAAKDRQIAALTEALDRYGMHEQGCRLSACTCGLDAALSGSTSALDAHTEEAVRPYKDALRKAWVALEKNFCWHKKPCPNSICASNGDALNKIAALLAGTAQPENKEEE